MVSDTAGKVIQCKAAVAWATNQPLSIETIEVAPPKAGEVRVRMVATGVCHSDAFFLGGGAGDSFFPVILGHEGAGIVESVGDGVTSVAPGDHVIPLYTPQCYECAACKSPNINTCSKNKMVQLAGLMSDGTTRFTCQGKTIRHSMGCSTFSEYIVVNDVNICKINPAAPLEKVCLIGCGVSTGYGAALNTAKVQPGSTVAIWGLGGVGLAAVMGAKKAGASRIFGIDINPEKAEIGKQFGVTDFLNPKDFDKPTEHVLREMTDGGVDFALECCGIISCMQSALQACHERGGVCTLVGLANLTERLPVSPFDLVVGRILKGTYFGGWKSRDSVPVLVDEYVAKTLKVDEFISHTLKLESINEAFDLMKQGKSIRTVITF